MKAKITHVSKSNPNGSYTITYQLIDDEGLVEQDKLEVLVEVNQSGIEVVRAKREAYEAALAAIDVSVDEEI
jgi:hypothetical protein